MIKAIKKIDSYKESEIVGLVAGHFLKLGTSFGLFVMSLDREVAHRKDDFMLQ